MPKHVYSEPSQELRGTVVAFNISPRGNIEGVLVETASGLVQVNLPKGEAEAFAGSLRVGGAVKLRAHPEGDGAGHPVYRAQSADVEAIGTIVRLNFALHGEPNGYHLDDGTFIHVKPEGAKKYGFRVGDRVKATGSRRAGADAVVLEADDVKAVGNGHEKGARA